MRSFSFLSIALVAALIVSACGEPQDSSEVTVDPSVVKSQSSALASAVSAAEGNVGASIGEELSEIGNTATSLIPRTRGAARAHVKGSASTCACPTAAQKTCTFSNCRIGSASASGTISWVDGKLVCTNVTFDVPASGTAGATHIAVTCSFTYSKGSLDGSLRTTGSTEVNGVAYTWDASLTANDLTWSTKTFTAGSVDVAAAVTTSSDFEGSDTFKASGSVEFP